MTNFYFLETVKSVLGSSINNYCTSQKTHSLNSECSSQLCSDSKVDLKPEFVFKGKGSQTHFTPQQSVNYQWAPRGIASY